MPGATYRLVVGSGSGIRDLAGNPLVAAAPTAHVSALADEGSKALSYSGSWRTLSSSSAVGRHYRASTPTTKHPTSLTSAFAGSGIQVKGCRGPVNGYLDVYVDGVRRGHVDTYRSYSGCGITLAKVTGLRKGNHKLVLKGTGTKRSSARSTVVAFDAFTAP